MNPIERRIFKSFACLLIGFGAGVAQPAGLGVVNWVAHACTTAGAGRASGCPQFGPASTNLSSTTAPGVSGPLPMQPTTAYSTIGNAASAYQTAGGWNGANAAADSTNNGFVFGVGTAAELNVEGINESESPAQYTFHFLINGGGLNLSINEFVANGSRYPTAEIVAGFIINKDFVDSIMWEYRGTLTAVNSEIPLIFSASVFDPKGLGLGTPDALVTQTGLAGQPRSAQVTLDPFVGTVPIPLIAAGAQITLDYYLFARVYTGEHNFAPNPLNDEPLVEGSAWIADPFGLNGQPVPGAFPDSGFDLDGQSLLTLTQVPGPQAGWLILTAFTGAASFVRRRGDKCRYLAHIAEAPAHACRAV